MATERETKIAAEMLTLALSDGLEFTPTLAATINEAARIQAANEVADRRHIEEKQACSAFGYPVNRCTKCDGSGFIERYAGLSGGRCYNCNGKGWTRA